jgi:hypothetical protein
MYVFLPYNNFWTTLHTSDKSDTNHHPRLEQQSFVFSKNITTGERAYPASCSMSTGIISWEENWLGRDNDLHVGPKLQIEAIPLLFSMPSWRGERNLWLFELHMCTPYVLLSVIPTWRLHYISFNTAIIHWPRYGPSGSITGKELLGQLPRLLMFSKASHFPCQGRNWH